MYKTHDLLNLENQYPLWTIKKLKVIERLRTLKETELSSVWQKHKMRHLWRAVKMFIQLTD